MQENWVQSLGRKDLLEEEMATTPVFLPEKSHGQRSLAGYSPWGHKDSDTQLSNSTATVKVRGAQLCPTLCDRMDYMQCMESSRLDYWCG